MKPAELVKRSPLGPHRRLYLLLRMRANQRQPRPLVYCACGARVTNGNPKVTKCNFCFTAERQAKEAQDAFAGIPGSAPIQEERAPWEQLGIY